MGDGLPASAITINLDCGGATDAAVLNEAGWPITATEIRVLAAYDDKLFAAAGLWMYDPTAADPPNPGPCILRLDSGNGDVVIEHSFRGIDTGLTLLYSAWFADVKKTVFVASTWNSRYCDLYVRDYSSSSWHFAQCLVEQAPGGSTMQIRSAITYTDPVDGVSRLFLGQQPHGIHSLAYDENARGGLGAATLELDTSEVDLIEYSTNARVMSFAVLSGELYCTVLNNLYRRENGPNACWHKVHTDTDEIGSSEAGWRGLTHAGPDPGGYFFVAREGSKAAILKLVPGADGTWTQTVSLDLIEALEAAWSGLYGGPVKVNYVIAAYNDMVWLQPPGKTHWALWIGIEATVREHPASMPVVLKPGYADIAALGSYLVWNWDKQGEWRLNQLPAVTSQPMVACRCGMPAPFPGGARFYVGGHDCNSIEAHNTGFLVSFETGRMVENAVA
jgi:hypothetical protein